MAATDARSQQRARSATSEDWDLDRGACLARFVLPWMSKHPRVDWPARSEELVAAVAALNKKARQTMVSLVQHLVARDTPLMAASHFGAHAIPSFAEGRFIHEQAPKPLGQVSLDRHLIHEPGAVTIDAFEEYPVEEISREFLHQNGVGGILFAQFAESTSLRLLTEKHLRAGQDAGAILLARGALSAGIETAQAFDFIAE